MSESREQPTKGKGYRVSNQEQDVQDPGTANEAEGAHYQPGSAGDTSVDPEEKDLPEEEMEVEEAGEDTGGEDRSTSNGKNHVPETHEDEAESHNNQEEDSDQEPIMELEPLDQPSDNGGDKGVTQASDTPTDSNTLSGLTRPPEPEPPEPEPEPLEPQPDKPKPDRIKERQPKISPTGTSMHQPHQETRITKRGPGKKKGQSSETSVREVLPERASKVFLSDDEGDDIRQAKAPLQPPTIEAEHEETGIQCSKWNTLLLFLLVVILAAALGYLIMNKDSLLPPEQSETIQESETIQGHKRIMEQLQSDPKMKDLIENWQTKEDDKTMSVLVTGKTGVGKSTLINGLLGRRVIRVDVNSLKPATQEVEAHVLNIGEVEIKVWDTRGFQEEEMDDERKYLEDMKRKCEKVDLVLYCLRMDDTRMREEDIDGIRKLTLTFGESIWKHALFVLTFANRVRPPGMQDLNKTEEYFEDKLNSWSEVLHIVLSDVGVSMDLETIHNKTVPAGSVEPHLPGRELWLSDLWLRAFYESTTHAKPLLLAIKNTERIAADKEDS